MEAGAEEAEVRTRAGSPSIRRGGLLLGFLAGTCVGAMGAALLFALIGSNDVRNPLRESAGEVVAAAISACPRVVAGPEAERCFSRALTPLVVAQSHPATFLPRLDSAVEHRGGALAEICHIVMHAVGRRYGQSNAVTLSSLQRYLPRSNNPACSAGFAHGLITSLGSGSLSATKAVATCKRSPTRYREYSCVHGLGHAYMRQFVEALLPALRSCENLGQRYAADCAQGAFHDYWFSLTGIDATQRRAGAQTSPRKVCGTQKAIFVRACWYRAFLEQPPRQPIRHPRDLLAICHGLKQLQLHSCITAGSLVASPNPFDQLHNCTFFSNATARACVRGVAAQTLAGAPPREQIELANGCAEFRQPADRSVCFSWLGRVLTVTTDGRFRTTGCTQVASVGRAACRSGAARITEPLETFS